MKRLLALILIFALMLSGCSLDFFKEEQVEKWPEDVLLRIGDTEIDYRECLVYLDAIRTDYERYYGKDIWTYVVNGEGGTLGDVVKQQMLDEMLYVKIVCEQAKKLNVTLSSDELAYVDTLANDYMIKIHGSELTKYEVNKSIVRKIYQDNALARKVFEQATLNIDTNISNEEAGQHHLYSIAIRNHKIGSSGERVEYSDTEKAEQKKRMEEMRNNAVLSDDFLAFATGVTENASMLDVFVGKGELEQSIEKAVLDLKDGEISPVLEAEDYYYIFYCKCALDIDKTLEKKEKIIATRQEEAFENFYAEWRSETDVKINEELWKNLNYLSE